MPSINSLKQVDHIAQIAKQSSRELSSLPKEGAHVQELVSAPAETLRAYAGIGITAPKVSKKIVSTPTTEEKSVIDLALAKLDECVSKEKKEYVAPKIGLSHLGFLPKIREASFTDCYDHISNIEISLTSGINGGHKKEFYTSLHSAITETVANIKKRIPGRIKSHLQSYLKENEIIESISDISSKEGSVQFKVKLTDGNIYQGTMRENGSILLNKPDGTSLDIKKSDTIKRNVFKEIFDTTKSTSLLREIRSKIKCDTTIQSAEVDGDTIILGLGDCKNLKMGDKTIDTKNLKLRLEPDVENGLEMYTQKYEYDYIDTKTGVIHHNVLKKNLPKTIVDENELDNVFNFIKANNGQGKHLFYSVPNPIENSPRNSFAFKYNNHYYMVDCCKDGENLDIHSIYPMQNEFLTKIISETNKIPDMTEIINAKVA